MRDLFRNRYRIASSRLPYYDYRQPGWYFITICTKEGQRYFGYVKDGHMELSSMGKIVAEEWLKTTIMRPHVYLDEWVVCVIHHSWIQRGRNKTN